MTNAAQRHRGYAGFLLVGTVVVLGLLVRQLFDVATDAHQPALRNNDMFSALGSVAMFALIAFVWTRPERKANP